MIEGGVDDWKYRRDYLYIYWLDCIIVRSGEDIGLSLHVLYYRFGVYALKLK